MNTDSRDTIVKPNHLLATKTVRLKKKISVDTAISTREFAAICQVHAISHAYRLRGHPAD